MSESINAEFEAYVKAELVDIAVVSDGRYISPKIQNYFKVWNHQQTRITKLEAQLADAKQVANDCRIVADNAIAEALTVKKDAERYREALEFVLKAFEPCKADYIFSKRLALTKARRAITRAAAEIGKSL